MWKLPACASRQDLSLREAGVAWAPKPAKSPRAARAASSSLTEAPYGTFPRLVIKSRSCSANPLRMQTSTKRKS